MHLSDKEQLVQFGRKMAQRGLTTGSGGNLSLIQRSRNRITITPSGLAYDSLTTEDMVVCDTEGKILEGRRKPSSEFGFHAALYKHRPDIGAVVHTHSVYATTMACLRKEIPAVHYLVGFAGAKVPLAPYAIFGTPALARAIVGSIGDNDAVLMANHGLVAVGPDLPAAFNVAEEIEFVARVYYQTLAVGKPHILSEAQMQEVLEKFATYGQS